MTYWLATLLGDETDLRMLADALSIAECQLLRRNGAFVLKSELFDPAESAEATRQQAIEIASRLSGASMVLLGTTRRIDVGGLVRVDETGREHTYVFPDSAVIRVRGMPVTVTVSHDDGTVETRRPGDPLNLWMQLATANPAVARALRIRARGPLDWDDILRMLEVVQSSGVTITDIPGAPSKSQLDRLTKTANSAHALGDRARHPGRNYAAPAIPITLDGARHLVDELAESWLKLLAAKRSDAA